MIHTHVIALHCSGSSAKQWRPLSHSLGGLAQIWSPDLIGCGSTRHWGGDRHFALADEAAPIVSMIDALARPVHLVGHSYGGAVALRVARERPSQIASLTLYEPMALHVLKTAGPEGRDALAVVNSVATDIDQTVLAGDHRTAARRFVEYWNRPGAWDALSPDAQAELVRYIPKACLEIRAVVQERTPLAAYRHFRVPVLLLQGQRAPEATQIIARQFARALRFASLRTVFAAGHMGPLTHAEAVARLMADFIGRQEDEGSAQRDDEAPIYDRAASGGRGRRSDGGPTQILRRSLLQCGLYRREGRVQL